MLSEPVTTADLIAVVRKDCLTQAKKARSKLTEVIEALEGDDHLGALGASDALDDDIACLRVFLTRIARVTEIPALPL